MEPFFKKHISALKTTVLILMLAIPFFLYAAAWNDLIYLVKLFIALMIGIMLFVMVKG